MYCYNGCLNKWQFALTLMFTGIWPFTCMDLLWPSVQSMIFCQPPSEIMESSGDVMKTSCTHGALVWLSSFDISLGMTRPSVGSSRVQIQFAQNAIISDVFEGQ